MDLLQHLQDQALEELGLDRESCEQNWKPSPVPLSASLGKIERAQQDFADLREILENVLPFREWLRTRPNGLKPRDYREYVGGVKDLLAELRNEFGLSLLAAKPTLVEQRQRPH